MPTCIQRVYSSPLDILSVIFWFMTHVIFHSTLRGHADTSDCEILNEEWLKEQWFRRQQEKN